MRYLMTLLLLSGLAAIAPTVAAQQAPAAASTAPAPAANPYQATVPVADTSVANRGHAFAAALAEVLSRASGHAPPDAALGKASTYVQQYQYQRAPAGSPQPFQLVVGFAPSAIQHLRKTLGAPLPATAGSVGDGTAAAILPAGGGDNVVWVSGIHSALDFADALAVLRDEPGVDNVAVRKAHGDGMLLDIHTSVPLAQVLAALGTGGRFAASGSAHAGAAASLRWHR